MKRWLAVSAALFCAEAMVGGTARAADSITIATGNAGGLYYAAVEAIRDAAPAVASLIPGEMSTQGLITPFHSAALDYYRAQCLPTLLVEIAPDALWGGLR